MARKAAYHYIVEVRPSKGNFATADLFARIVERDRASAVGRHAADELPGSVIDRPRLRGRGRAAAVGRRGVARLCGDLARQNDERQCGDYGRLGH